MILRTVRDCMSAMEVKIQQLCSYAILVLCIGSNLGLKFGRERPIRVLLPHLAEPKIYK